MIKNCLNCNKEFHAYPSEIKYGRGKFCSHSCKSSGKFNSHWRGGRRIKKGYVLIWIPTHPNSNSEGYMLEHRLVMEKSIGRYLTLEEVVHHKNKKTDDNRVSNLELFATDSDHRTNTIRGRENPNYRHGRNVVTI